MKWVIAFVAAEFLLLFLWAWFRDWQVERHRRRMQGRIRLVEPWQPGFRKSVEKPMAPVENQPRAHGI